MNERVAELELAVESALDLIAPEIGDDDPMVLAGRDALDELVLLASRATSPYLTVVSSPAPLTAVEYERIRDSWVERNRAPEGQTWAPVVASSPAVVIAYDDERPGLFRSWWEVAIVAGAGLAGIAVVWFLVWLVGLPVSPS